MRPPWPLVVPASPSLPLSCLARPWRLFASAPPPGMLVRTRVRLVRHGAPAWGAVAHPGGCKCCLHPRPPGLSRSLLARWPPPAAATAAAAAAPASAARPPPCRALRGPSPRTRPPALRVVATSGRPVAVPGPLLEGCEVDMALLLHICNVRLRGCPPGRSVSLVCVPLQAKLLVVSCNVCGSESASAPRRESPCPAPPPACGRAYVYERKNSK